MDRETLKDILEIVETIECEDVPEDGFVKGFYYCKEKTIKKLRKILKSIDFQYEEK